MRIVVCCWPNYIGCLYIWGLIKILWPVPTSSATPKRNVEDALRNKLAKFGDAIAISNMKLSITDPLTDPLTACQ